MTGNTCMARWRDVAGQCMTAHGDLRPGTIRGVDRPIGVDRRFRRAIGVDRRSGDEFGRGPGSEGVGPKGMGPDGGAGERTCKTRAAHMDDADYLGVANGT